MLSLAQISSKYKDIGNLENRVQQEQLRTFVDVDDPEWTVYLKKLQTEEDQMKTLLLSEFQRKSKESGGGGKCVEYLRKLFVHSHRISLKLSGRSDAMKSVIMLFRTLSSLAKGEWSLPSQTIDDVMACGMSAVRDFPSSVLAKFLIDHAMDDMKDAENSLTCRWIEMFVRFMVVLGERGDIPLESDTVDGQVFRGHIIQQMCRMDWTRPVFKSYLTILEEIPGIEATEMDAILKKFGLTLRKMQPSLVHSCVGQIVGIAGNLLPTKVLKMFDTYFIEIQEKQGQEERNLPRPESRKRPAPGKTPTVQHVSLGIVACNFVDAARHSDPLIREILKRVKASVFDHVLVMTPFILSLILAFTSVDYLKQSIIDPLKMAILKNFHELNLCGESCWYKDTIGEIRDDITSCFKYVLKEGASAMDYMCDGLKDLGISLLNSSTLQVKYPRTFKRCQELGTFLVTTVVMMNKEQLGLLLKELLRPESTAHIDCLASCLSQCSRAVGQRDFHGRVTELLQHLPSMSVESASAIMKSLLPSIQMSPALLDDLMIVLRKTFWKSVNAGRICVEVICVILSNTYLMGNSQFEVSDLQNDDLILSQLTQGNSRTNVDYTPLCREILNLGKRFFSLDCKVREQLYLGLHRVARRNPMVNDVISGQLHAHLMQYWKDEEGHHPIQFKKLFEFSPLKDIKAIFKDELGFLVQCLGFVYNKTNLATDEFLDGFKDTSSFTNCKELLKQLIHYLKNLEVSQLQGEIKDIIDESGIQTNDVNRYVKDIVCNQTRQMLDAVMEFLALASEWPNAKNDILKIFQRAVDVEKFAKEKPTVKKGEKGKGKGKKDSKKADTTKKGNTTKKGDTTKVTQLDTDNEVSATSGSVETVVRTAKTKLIDNSLKPPPYFRIINLDSVCQMLREIYGPRKKTKNLKHVQGYDKFEYNLLTTVKEKLQKLRSKESIRERQRAPIDTLNSLTCLVETIWGRFCTMEETWKTDDQSPNSDSNEVVELRLKVITSILDYFHVEGHVSRVKYFNKYLLGAERDEHKFCGDMFRKWSRILEMLSERFDDEDNGNATASMFTLLNTICQVLTSLHVLEEIQNWCWHYFKECDVKNHNGTTNLVEHALAAFLACNTKCSKLSSGTNKDALKLARTIPLTIGTVHNDGQTTGDNRMGSWVVTPDTVSTVYVCLSNYVERQISMLNTILGRLKAHRLYLGDDKSIEMRDKCFEMIQSVRRIITELVRSRIEAGPCVGCFLKVVTQFYSLISGFAEHLIDVNKSAQEPINIQGFKGIVSSLGREMKPLIESMITHVEVVQRERMTKLAAKAKPKNAARIPAMMKAQFAKDARLIPNMVYHIERFDQFVISLSKNVKVDLLVGMKLSTARDFRMQAYEAPKPVGRPDTVDSSKRSTTANSTTRPGTSSTARTGSEKPGSKLSRKRKL